MAAFGGTLYLVSVWVIPVVIAITFHEAAHGFVAYRLGDDTAMRLGRVTFNPLRHVDPFGTILLPGLLLLLRVPFLFGYAKPVPVNFARLNRPRRDMVLVAAAGPGINLVLAFLAALMFHALPWAPERAQDWVAENLQNAIMINLVLAVFNMLPIPPLDGGRVLTGLLPPSLGRRFVSRHRHAGGVRMAMTESVESFEGKEPAPEPERLVVDVDGYEGPIDVLLTLAREQKVDLKRISILELVEQYLVFVQTARRLRLELAADYLVIAAWLAYLKSRLLLPEPPDDDEPSGEELAAQLTFQLERLHAMQTASVRLMARARLGIDRFPRGEPQDLRSRKRPVYDVTLYDLLSAYGDYRAREEGRTLRIAPTELYAVDQALDRLKELIGRSPDWQTLTSFLPAALKDGLIARSALASTFVASLELAREGKLQLRQLERFGPIYLRGMRSSQ